MNAAAADKGVAAGDDDGYDNVFALMLMMLMMLLQMTTTIIALGENNQTREASIERGLARDTEAARVPDTGHAKGNEGGPKAECK